MLRMLAFVIVPAVVVVVVGCAGDPTDSAAHSSVAGHEVAPVASAAVGGDAARELAAARAATARYQDLENALADGYVDIDVVYQNMGHHYLKSSLLDDTFQPDQPELLVYAPGPNGRMRLVAVEYAVPLDVAPSAPAGFSGDADAWDRNETFQLWTLHAWIWLNNPAGTFASHNQRVVLQ
jgi:hypothetical protein